MKKNSALYIIVTVILAIACFAFAIDIKLNDSRWVLFAIFLEMILFLSMVHFGANAKDKNKMKIATMIVFGLGFLADIAGIILVKDAALVGGLVAYLFLGMNYFVAISLAASKEAKKVIE